MHGGKNDTSNLLSMFNMGSVGCLFGSVVLGSVIVEMLLATFHSSLHWVCNLSLCYIAALFCDTSLMSLYDVCFIIRWCVMIATSLAKPHPNRTWKGSGDKPVPRLYCWNVNYLRITSEVKGPQTPGMLYSSCFVGTNCLLVCTVCVASLLSFLQSFSITLQGA